MKPTLDVVAGIIWRNGWYLAVERPEGMRMAGWWEFPGGKVDPGETPEQAVVRELQEELGVTAVDCEFWRELVHEYEDFFVRLRFYHVRDFTGTLTACEGQDMVWVDPAHPEGVKFLPADIRIVDDLRTLG
ncbi:(deoxy)nucleoside triphosphate pyrophosphohydrolase [Pseudodesulfovibrio tunisiensis]|uniref:(deoxy)nucleoside triphosphate pyrophosphohydrolase n=1 Tax=Pseudodesulfovibrio tunisiensis TaxID=463192 RepID=UPI001FB3DB9D|nr:(deoxy)nucleoside triphosphate pyrophosphohydrolase [Pseudodesulfovibrio tunisiensis]